MLTLEEEEAIGEIIEAAIEEVTHDLVKVGLQQALILEQPPLDLGQLVTQEVRLDLEQEAIRPILLALDLVIIQVMEGLVLLIQGLEEVLVQVIQDREVALEEVTQDLVKGSDQLVDLAPQILIQEVEVLAVQTQLLEQAQYLHLTREHKEEILGHQIQEFLETLLFQEETQLQATQEQVFQVFHLMVVEILDQVILVDKRAWDQ